MKAKKKSPKMIGRKISPQAAHAFSNALRGMLRSAYKDGFADGQRSSAARVSALEALFRQTPAPSASNS